MSGCLNLMMTMGRAAVQISDQNISHVTVGTAIAGYRLLASGIVQKQQGASLTTVETWLLTGAASAYEARATLTAGAITSGTLNTWLGLGSDRAWSCTDSDPMNPSVSATLLIEIRASGGSVLDSATINLTAISA